MNTRTVSCAAQGYEVVPFVVDDIELAFARELAYALIERYRQGEAAVVSAGVSIGDAGRRHPQRNPDIDLEQWMHEPFIIGDLLALEPRFARLFSRQSIWNCVAELLDCAPSELLFHFGNLTRKPGETGPAIGWHRGAQNTYFASDDGRTVRLIKRVDEELRIGAAAMTWHYDRNFSGYTLGQGGYYSPQRYLSFGVPVSYAWRNPDWSVYLEGSLGYSSARSDDQRTFPLSLANDDIVSHYVGAQGNIDGTRENSKGLGYLAQALVERRLDDHRVLGGGFTLQRSEDYSPNRALLYLRYSFDPWQGNLPLPVNPLKPYAEFR